MQTYQVTYDPLGTPPLYEVSGRSLGLVATIRGRILGTSPNLTLREGYDGRTLAGLRADYRKTKFECKEPSGASLGILSFPMIALKRAFTLEAGGQLYKAEGGFCAREFECRDAQESPVLVISTQASPDRFQIATSGALPAPLALLVAVAIDQRFFQEEALPPSSAKTG